MNNRNMVPCCFVSMGNMIIAPSVSPSMRSVTAISLNLDHMILF